MLLSYLNACHKHLKLRIIITDYEDQAVPEYDLVNMLQCNPSNVHTAICSMIYNIYQFQRGSISCSCHP